MRPDETSRRRKKRAKPLDSERLEALALHYVGRYATSRMKLTRYLSRKLRERGWEDERSPDLDDIVARFAKAGYIDDSAYASMRARDLAARGYGERRLAQRLYADGIAEGDRDDAEEYAAGQRVESALKFAARKRLGPFASERNEDPKIRERQLASMVRAGHEFGLSKRILGLKPGVSVDPDDLREP